MTSSITAKACEAWFLMEAADLRGLPTPYSVGVTDYAHTQLGLTSVADLRVWAEALGTEVTCRAVNGRTHYATEGELLEMAVSVFVVTPAAVTA